MANENNKGESSKGSTGTGSSGGANAASSGGSNFAGGGEGSGSKGTASKGAETKGSDTKGSTGGAMGGGTAGGEGKSTGPASGSADGKTGSVSSTVKGSPGAAGGFAAGRSADRGSVAGYAEAATRGDRAVTQSAPASSATMGGMAAGRAAERGSQPGYAGPAAVGARGDAAISDRVASGFATGRTVPSMESAGLSKSSIQGAADRQSVQAMANIRATDRASVPAYAGSTSKEQVVAGAKMVAERFGLEPRDVLAMVSYETAGTFDPQKVGPTTKWGQHTGLFQAGDVQRKELGIRKDTNALDQMYALGDYLEQRGMRPGMGVTAAYAAINGGNVRATNAKDEAAGGMPGTVSEKVRDQFGPHYEKADSLLSSIETANARPTANPARATDRPITGTAVASAATAPAATARVSTAVSRFASTYLSEEPNADIAAADAATTMTPAQAGVIAGMDTPVEARALGQRNQMTSRGTAPTAAAPGPAPAPVSNLDALAANRSAAAGVGVGDVTQGANLAGRNISRSDGAGVALSGFNSGRTEVAAAPAAAPAPSTAAPSPSTPSAPAATPSARPSTPGPTPSTRPTLGSATAAAGVGAGAAVSVGVNMEPVAEPGARPTVAPSAPGEVDIAQAFDVSPAGTGLMPGFSKPARDVGAMEVFDVDAQTGQRKDFRVQDNSGEGGNPAGQPQDDGENGDGGEQPEVIDPYKWSARAYADTSGTLKKPGEKYTDLDRFASKYLT